MHGLPLLMERRKRAFRNFPRSKATEPDWLLLYKIDGNDLILARTGTHADLFR
jgi:mRNA-degrading endonuclease YafQ of YafQ-DinJ toxin-antitoxin module